MLIKPKKYTSQKNKFLMFDILIELFSADVVRPSAHPCYFCGLKCAKKSKGITSICEKQNSLR